MVGVAVGLLVLGSLPAAYGSVWLALGSLADRRGVVHQDTRGRGRLTRFTVGTSRRAQGLLRSLPEVVKPLVVVALPALLAWWIVRVGRLDRRRVDRRAAGLAARPAPWRASWWARSRPSTSATCCGR